MPIRACVQCVFRDGDRLLGFLIKDPTSAAVGFRSVGGGIEDGETSERAVRREVEEELGVLIEGLRLLGVLENIFTYDGRPGHEVVFVYEARFVDAADYDRDFFEIHEEAPPEWAPYHAIWKHIDEFKSGGLALYPPDLLDLLDRIPAAL